jgi:hypothetical protein
MLCDLCTNVINSDETPKSGKVENNVQDWPRMSQGTMG